MTDGNHLLTPLERWRAMAFLLAGTIFVVDAALLGANLVAGARDPALPLAQAFVGAAWTAAFVGLLGFYPSLSDRNRWGTRAAGGFAVVGAVTTAAMAVTSFGLFTGVLSGNFADVTPYFLPGVFLGIVFGVGTFGVLALRSHIYSRSVGLLFLLLPVTFLFNLGTGIAGFNPLPKVLGVVSVLALTMLAIGYLLRTGSAVADQAGVERASSASTG